VTDTVEEEFREPGRLNTYVADADETTKGSEENTGKE
jgi:hypothetical protein